MGSAKSKVSAFPGARAAFVLADQREFNLIECANSRTHGWVHFSGHPIYAALEATYNASNVASLGHVAPSPLPIEVLLQVKWPLSPVVNAPKALPTIFSGPSRHLIVVPHLTKISKPSLVAVASSALPSRCSMILPGPPTEVTKHPPLQAV